jgi:hypothetical protein
MRYCRFDESKAAFVCIQQNSTNDPSSRNRDDAMISNLILTVSVFNTKFTLVSFLH